MLHVFLQNSSLPDYQKTLAGHRSCNFWNCESDIKTKFKKLQHPKPNHSRVQNSFPKAVNEMVKKPYVNISTKLISVTQNDYQIKSLCFFLYLTAVNLTITRIPEPFKLEGISWDHLSPTSSSAFTYYLVIRAFPKYHWALPSLKILI